MNREIAGNMATVRVAENAGVLRTFETMVLACGDRDRRCVIVASGWLATDFINVETLAMGKAHT
jgi:hypothetical protein